MKAKQVSEQFYVISEAFRTVAASMEPEDDPTRIRNVLAYWGKISSDQRQWIRQAVEHLKSHKKKNRGQEETDLHQVFLAYHDHTKIRRREGKSNPEWGYQSTLAKQFGVSAKTIKEWVAETIDIFSEQLRRRSQPQVTANEPLNGLSP